MMMNDYHAKSEPRRENDFYPTPEKAVPAFLQYANVKEARRILDVGAGTGVWGEAIRKINPHAHITGIDVQSFERSFAYDQWISGQDYLKWDEFENFDLVIGNPPFALWRDIVHKAMSNLVDGGYLSLFLRLQSLESQKTANLLEKYPLKVVLVSVRRVPFLSKYGIKDSKTAYAQYIWQKGYAGDAILKWTDWENYGGKE